MAEPRKTNFGISGLDDITSGGLTQGRLFLLEGNPGTGKTTIATQWLIAGAGAAARDLIADIGTTGSRH